MPGHWYFSPKQRKAAFRSGRFAIDKDSNQWPGLVGAWPLAVHAGNVLDWDYSGNSRHGARSGYSPGDTVRRAVNHPRYGGVQAGFFDGVDDLVTIGAGVNLVGISFSVSFSASRRSVGGPSTWILTQGVGLTDQNLHIGFLTSNLLTFAFWNDDLSSISTFPDATWHEFLCTYDAGSNTQTIYVDGISDNSRTADGDYIGSGDVLIGMRHDGGYYDGLLKDTRIYNRDQPASMVAKIYEHPEDLWYPLGTRAFFLPAPELESSSSSQSSSSSSSVSSSSVSSSSVSSVSSSSSTGLIEIPVGKTITVIGPAGATIAKVN